MNLASSTRKTMRPADPAAHLDLPDRAVIDAAYRRIVATAPEPAPAIALPRTYRRRLALGLAAAGVAGVVTAVVVIPSSGGTAYAATPPPLRYQLPSPGTADAAAELNRLARIAAARPAPRGDVAHIHLRQWALSTSVDGAGGTDTVTSKVITEDIDWFKRPSGVTVTRRLLDGKSRPESGSDPATAFEDRQVPSTPEALRTWLGADQPGVGIGDAAGMNDAVVDLMISHVLTPRQQSALLRTIATTPGLRYRGTVRDRAGRDGEAFTAESAANGLPTRFTFIVDPATGSLLGQESMLTKTAGSLNVRIPSVIAYQVYLTSERRSE
ncbi:hypothetical protein SAMN05216251_102535 [Actinacidiphila alni]|uniref:CU044_5270 family protein n=1 Tax=Actinacidiphila alni TaxID=380248 RepID=A0A1I1ZQ12_9ACTN|nr:CU044_5270 family protein [Actinacidiphila alni]SFE33751.1 hypothetical protein SAMN05216251_102535 [Actinacidiphila alni]